MLSVKFTSLCTDHVLCTFTQNVSSILKTMELIEHVEDCCIRSDVTDILGIALLVMLMVTTTKIFHVFFMFRDILGISELSSLELFFSSESH